MAAGGMVAESDTGIGFTPVPNDVSSPTVGIGGGSAVVGWRASDSNGVHSQIATRTFTGNGADPPSAVQLFGDPAGNTLEDQISVDATGDALVTWTDAPPAASSSALPRSVRPAARSASRFRQATERVTRPAFRTASTMRAMASSDGSNHRARTRAGGSTCRR